MICMLRTMEYPQLKQLIGEGERIVLITCNVCVRQCGLGGPKATESLKGLLDRDGYDVVATLSSSAPCLSDRIRRDIPEFDVAISLTCDEAVWNLRRAFPERRFIEVMKTIGSCVMEGGAPLLIRPMKGIELEIPLEGMPLTEAARILGMYETPFT